MEEAGMWRRKEGGGQLPFPLPHLVNIFGWIKVPKRLAQKCDEADGLLISIIGEVH
jgi:hypothetical protein